MQSRTTDSRIAAAYAHAQKCHDRRTSDQLQRLVLDTGERLIRIAPQHNVFEDALDFASAVYVGGQPPERLAHVARLAGIFLEADALGYTPMTHIERQACRALVARHDAAEGRGNHLLDIARRH